MGHVYKATFTKPLPPDAEVFTRKGRQFAKWVDAKRKTRTAPLTTAGDRIIVEARTYTAKYRNASGLVLKIATGCRDEQAARAILADLERRAVRVKAKLLTEAEDAVADHLATPLGGHIADYIAALGAVATSAVYRDNVRRALERLAADCNCSTLVDLNRNSLERWLAAQSALKMGARTRNTYRAAVVAFCNWAVRVGRLASNPLAGIAKADEQADPRRKRRSMNEAELVKLLDVARRRPLLDALLIRRGKHKGEAIAKVRPEVVERLERLGRERALIYKTLLLTGLRKGELASLTVGQLQLDGPHPFAELAAADEKNREGSTIPLRADLADDLRQWLADRATALQQAASNAPTVRFDSTVGQPSERGTSDSGAIARRLCQPLTDVPQLPSDAPLFTVPSGLVRILDRDLVLAAC